MYKESDSLNFVWQPLDLLEGWFIFKPIILILLLLFFIVWEVHSLRRYPRTILRFIEYIWIEWVTIKRKSLCILSIYYNTQSFKKVCNQGFSKICGAVLPKMFSQFRKLVNLFSFLVGQSTLKFEVVISLTTFISFLMVTSSTGVHSQ